MCIDVPHQLCVELTGFWYDHIEDAVGRVSAESVHMLFADTVIRYYADTGIKCIRQVVIATGTSHKVC